MDQSPEFRGPAVLTQRVLRRAAVGILALVALAGTACMRRQDVGYSRPAEVRPHATHSVTAPLRGRHRISVGTSPSDILLVDGGRTLVCKNIEEHSLSLIDLATSRETARVRLPVTAQDPDGEPTTGYLTGLTEDPATGTLWAVSNEGQIFTVDLRTCQTSTRHTIDPNDGLPADYLAAAWDPDRSRLLISAAEGGPIEGERGTLLSFASGRLESIVTTSMPIWQVRRRGSMLYYVSSKSGIVDEGSFDSAVGALDLTSDRTAFEHTLERGVAEDVAILPDGHLLVADSSMCRLLEYTAMGTLRITREIGGDSSPDTVQAAGRRIVVMEHGTTVRRVLVYHMTDRGLSRSPTHEYRINEGEMGGVALLPGGGLAVSLCRANRVLLLGADEAKPFSGFPEESHEAALLASVDDPGGQCERRPPMPATGAVGDFAPDLGSALQHRRE